MAYTHFTNATPFTVKVRIAGTDSAVAVLKPCDEASAKTPRGAEFEVTDDSDRFVIGRDLSAKNETQNLLITDEDIRSKASATTPVPAKLVNTLPYAVTIQKVQPDGKEMTAGQIGPGEERGWDGAQAGAAFRARRAPAGEKLDMFAPAPPKTPGEAQTFRIADRYQILRRLAQNEPSLKLGRYDIVKADVPPPDPADTKYIRYGHQNIGSGELNGWERPLRRVTISGVDLIFDTADQGGFLKTYEGQQDIAELCIDADTVVVKRALRFPGTKVFLHCRALQFEGAESCIDTTPIDKTYRDPLSINGENGANGGNFAIHASYFRTDQQNAKHFRARGARGQDPDPGGVEPSATARNLKPITEQEWNNFFSYENRKLPHEEIFWNKWGYTAVMPFPEFRRCTENHPNIVYIEIRNRYYTDNLHIRWSDYETLHTWGTKADPGKGGKGKRPGKPGVGGSGGNFTSRLPQLEPYADLSGGPSGTPLGPTPGGIGGAPTVVNWLFFEGYPDGSGHHVPPRVENKMASRGESSEPGPQPDAPTGKPGSFSVENKKSYAWVSLLNLSVVTQYARDACASGNADYATALLTPYVNALAGQTVDFELEQPLREARELLRLSSQNADYFGKPPGWVPTLSLESAAGIYGTLLPQAMNQLYASYYIEKIAQSKQDKQHALLNLRTAINDSSNTAKDELRDLRKGLPKAMDGLKQLLLEMEGVDRKLKGRETELRKKADEEMKSQEEKEAIAAGFKIAGAVVKAIPLPEPYQTAAGALGGVLDITGGLVEGSGSDDAFQNLKTQVKTFTEDNKDSLTEYLNSNLDTTLDVSALEKEAAAAKKDKEALEAKYGDQAKQVDELKKKREELYNAQKEALIYSRASSLQEREKIVKAAGKVTTNYQDDVSNIEEASKEKLTAFNAAKTKLAGIEGDITAKKAEFAKNKEARDKKKEENKKTVATRMKQLQNVANSVASISSTISKLGASRAQLNAKFDQALARIKTADPEFSSLAQQIKFLNEKKATVAKQVAQITANIASRTDKISRNMLALNEIAAQIATNNESLEPNALAYIQSIGQDAHATLTRFLYYTVKAYEYYMAAPWAQSYVSAQKLFDDLRRVLEPSNFKLDAITDPQGDKQKQIQALLAAPDPRQGGMLSAADFALLKMVYEKPMLDMGKQLAGELMESTGKALKETKSTVTLTADWLGDLNDRIQSPDKLNEVIFNLVDLRQIGRSVEKQRISNIRVIGVKAIRQGERYPDTVKFTFEHMGKSIVRARGHLFAFEPQGTTKDEDASGGYAGVSFETQGGKGKSKKAIGWEETIGGKTGGTLSAGSLWQPDKTSQENLLSKLLNNPATLSLSQFRPGAFSDFLLKVEISPPERKIALTEVTLEISYEGGYASSNQILVCVNNNLGQEIPVSTNIKDMSGRNGAFGRYIGVFNAKEMAAAGQRAVRVSTPPEFGEFKLKSWLIDGEIKQASDPCYDAAKDAYIVANYEKKPSATPAAL